MNLILVQPEDIDGNRLATLRDEAARHAVDVLKVTAGTTVRIGLLNGPMGLGTVTAVSGHEVSIRCAFDGVVPERPRLDVMLALPRPKVLRRLWAQLAALGVGRIIVCNAERVERHYFDTHILGEGTYRPLLIEGLQQARDTWLPMVSIHRRFRKLVEDELSDLFPSGRRIVAHPGSGDLHTATASMAKGERVLLAVGPEGGWNDFEMKLLAAHGFHPFEIGGHTLRTDTACIALIALVNREIAGRKGSGGDPG